MKKVILFLFLMLSVQSFAQITRHVEFDFTNPTALNPSITPKTENAQTVMVTDRVFQNSGVKISFERVNQFSPGARITTSVLNGKTSYYLSWSSITDMTFAVENGATLNEISFSQDTHYGGFYLKEDQKGYVDPTVANRKWVDNNAENVTSVTFRNTDQESQFYHIYVTYTEPSAVLSPVSTSIPQYGTVESFDKFTMDFADNMTLYSSNGIILSNGTKTWNMSASISGKTVTLSAPETIAQDGTYTLSIPAKCFKNANGYENQALTYTFTVNTPKNILNFESVNPAQGNIDKLSSGIVLTYPTFINVKNADLVLKYNDTDLVPVKITKKDGDSKSAILTFEGVEEGITDKGVYTITIPENTIIDLMGKYYNPAFTLRYEIGGTTPDPKPDPEPDPKPEDSETMKTAKKLVALSGVGYPTAESASKKKLKDLTEAETVPSDDELNAAIVSLYAESNVELPTAGKWYTIANVDPEGNKRYLTVKDNAISVSTTEAEATAFEAGENGSFKTIDGKYLYTNGLRDVETSLELKKFNLTSAEAEKTFGKVSIYGFCKTNAIGKEFDAYALVDCVNNKLATDETIEELYFAMSLSSAFALAETNKPDEEIKTVETAYTITPDVVESGTDLTLTFTGLQDVVKSSDFDAYIANVTGERIESASVIASASQSNQFTISLSSFDNGNYQVIFPEGSFLYEKDGKTVQTQLIKKAFTIGKGGSGDDGNFSYTYTQVIVLPSVNNIIKDSDLNNFTIRILRGDYTDLVADPSKTVRIAKYNNNQTMATGHFEDSSESDAYYKVLKLVLDNPIAEGSFAKNLYAVVIEEGTFGDANFAKYLADKTSVSAKDCRVNSRLTISYNVDNEAATGIDEISIDSAKETIIYDLMGRRVKSMTRPGIYIVNGKKVVKK